MELIKVSTLSVFFFTYIEINRSRRRRHRIEGRHDYENIKKSKEKSNFGIDDRCTGSDNAYRMRK